jgi:hypothetical protein
MRGAIPPFQQSTFMAWCSVKKNHKENFTLSVNVSNFTPWSRVLEKLIITQLVKKFPSFYGT